MLIRSLKILKLVCSGKAFHERLTQHGTGQEARDGEKECAKGCHGLFQEVKSWRPPSHQFLKERLSWPVEVWHHLWVESEDGLCLVLALMLSMQVHVGATLGIDNDCVYLVCRDSTHDNTTKSNHLSS